MDVERVSPASDEIAARSSIGQRSKAERAAWARYRARCCPSCGKGAVRCAGTPSAYGEGVVAGGRMGLAWITRPAARWRRADPVGRERGASRSHAMQHGSRQPHTPRVHSMRARADNPKAFDANGSHVCTKENSRESIADPAIFKSAVTPPKHSGRFPREYEVILAACGVEVRIECVAAVATSITMGRALRSPTLPLSRAPGSGTVGARRESTSQQG